MDMLAPVPKPLVSSLSPALREGGSGGDTMDLQCLKVPILPAGPFLNEDRAEGDLLP